MIIMGLMELVYSLFSLLTSPINIPSLPDSIGAVAEMLLGAISTGLGLLACYCHLDYLLSLWAVLIAVDLGLYLYKFVMWILKKIPMLGVS